MNPYNIVSICALSAALASTSLSVAYAFPECAPNSGGKWETLSPLGMGLRQEHAAAAIDRKIYVVGGIVPRENSSIVTVNTMEAYNLDSDTWTPAAPLPVPVNHPNIASTGGKLYSLCGLSGNINGSFWGLVDAFEYDPLTDAWSALPPLPDGTGRGSSIVGVYRDEIILAGGVSRIEQALNGIQDTVATVSAYNIKKRTWRSLPPLPEGREHAGGAVIGQNFYVVGGRIKGPQNNRDTVFVLSLKTWKWSERSPMPTARGGISVAAIRDRIYAFGGENSDQSTGFVHNETEVYNVSEDCWESLEPMALPRHGFAAVALGGAIYTPGGGLRNFGFSDQLQAFHPGENRG